MKNPYFKPFLFIFILILSSGCSVKFRDRDITLKDPSAKFEDNINVTTEMNPLPVKLGSGRATCFYIAVKDVNYDGNASRDLLAQVEKAVKKVGYRTERAGPHEKIRQGGLRLRYRVDEFDSNNFTWLFPFVPTWGHIAMTFSLENANGKKIWENSYKSNKITMNFTDGYSSVANSNLSKILNELITDLSAPDFNKMVKNGIIEARKFAKAVPSKKAIAKEPILKISRKTKKKRKTFVNGQKWAVVAGVSKYKNAGNNQITNLRYAANDAQAMADFLKSPKGGGFDNVYVMVDKDVTYKNMRYALFDYLGQALEEDMVLFFFAGHGAPDPNEPKNLYLLTYDTDPNSVSSTAFPMWDVETALKRYIKAETVVMLTDACHSGGVNPSFGTRGITVEDNPTNDAILNLAHSPGMVSITASEAREVSHESKKWGGGHGVFTHFLLEGLKGKADVDGDSTVSLGEMIDYTSEQVRRATRNRQHPDVSGSFDREMPMSIVK